MCSFHEEDLDVCFISSADFALILIALKVVHGLLDLVVGFVPGRTSRNIIKICCTQVHSDAIHCHGRIIPGRHEVFELHLLVLRCTSPQITIGFVWNQIVACSASLTVFNPLAICLELFITFITAFDAHYSLTATSFSVEAAKALKAHDVDIAFRVLDLGPNITFLTKITVCGLVA